MFKNKIVSGRKVYEVPLHNAGQIKIVEELIGCEINSRIVYIPEKKWAAFLYKLNKMAQKRKCGTKIEDLAV